VTDPAPAWTVRPYQAGDEPALVELFGRVFGRPISVDHWRWKLKSLPSPAENVWLAVADGRPIFQYAGIPLRFQTPAGETTAMVSVDTMTDPDFRRRGLLTSVGAVAYERWRAAGVSVVLGLPNDKWGSRTGALNWQPLFGLRWLIRPLRPEAIAARRMGLAPGGLAALGGLWNIAWDRGLRAEPGLSVTMVGRAGAAFDQLWARCRDSLALSVVRDSAWVNWRYLAAPGQAYRVLLAERDGAAAGYIAYRLERGGGRPWGMIAELTTIPGDEAARRTLLGRAVAHLRAAGAEAIATLAIPGSALERSYRRAGFVFGRPGAFTVQYVPLATGVPAAVFRDPDGWALAGGDFDVI
jgi:hypothetical protein